MSPTLKLALRRSLLRRNIPRVTTESRQVTSRTMTIAGICWNGHADIGERLLSQNPQRFRRHAFATVSTGSDGTVGVPKSSDFGTLTLRMSLNRLLPPTRFGCRHKPCARAVVGVVPEVRVKSLSGQDWRPPASCRKHVVTEILCRTQRTWGALNGVTPWSILR